MKPLKRFDIELPQPKDAKISAVSVCVKQASSRYCVKKGKTVHGAVPGAPWARISTKVGYLNNWNTFGKFLVNVERKPCVRRFSAKLAACGSSTNIMMPKPTEALKATTMMTLNLQPASVPMSSAAKLVATRPNKVLQTAPTKNSEPKAVPRLDGGFLSATMLNNSGCTMPRPTPLSTRPAKSISKQVAPAQSARPMAQKSMPYPTSRGRGSNSPTKPQGNANRAADQPLTVDNKLSSVCDT
mmetsp:Transcript_2612/g.7503  ORF Transcript_2612/g.7503 Transcript_2612/m.7503 type:complete len:242 (-) Transcript_2612:278-1003(-)